MEIEGATYFALEFPMLTLQELLPLTNITRRQLSNRIKPLQSRYPNLIKGGGRGRGGKFSIHPVFIEYLTQPNTETILSPEQKENKRFLIKNFIDNNPYDNHKTFNSIGWDYFGGFNPKYSENPNGYLTHQKLIELIPLEPGDICYYSIHYDMNNIDDISHIHFVIATKQTKSKIEHYPKIKQIPKVVPFDETKREGCYHYFTNPNLYRDNQRIGEVGFRVGMV